MRRISVLRRFRHARVWMASWLLMMAVVVVLSLMPHPPIPSLLAVARFDHVIAYLALTAFAVQLYADRDAQLLATMAMAALGILMELAQGYLATGHDMSFVDACADIAGAAVGLATSWLRVASMLQRVEARWLR